MQRPSSSNNDCLRPIHQWFTHLFEHLLVPFMALGKWVKSLFKRRLIKRSFKGDAQALGEFLENDIQPSDVKSFLENDIQPSDVKSWLVFAGLDPTAPLDTEAAELQLKMVILHCRPSCYNGYLPLVDPYKLRCYLETSTAKALLDESFYSRLMVRVSSIKVDEAMQSTLLNRNTSASGE